MSKNPEEKVRKALEQISPVLKDLGLNDKEYLLLTANLLFAFGTAGTKNTEKLNKINILDANVIELEYLKSPENVYLAAILQSHALIKWSESVSN